MCYLKRCLYIFILLAVCGSLDICSADSGYTWLYRSRSQWIREFGSNTGPKAFECCALLVRASVKPLDLTHVREICEKGELRPNAYKLLDQALAREKLLDGADKLALEMEKAAPSKKLTDEFLKPRETLSRFLRCRMRLIVGIARASIAQSMALPASRSYCSQAMETSIDALRDAIKLADDKASGPGAPNPPASAITRLRNRLLEIWDKSQKTADVGPIRDMELEKVIAECGVW